MKQALVLISIILGVAIALELEHLNRILGSKKVKWHWAQPLFALFVLLSIVSFWWGTAKSDQGEISLGAFLPIMFQLVMLVLAAGVSLPENVPAEGLDLAEYYQEKKAYQWGLMATYAWTLNISYFIYLFSKTNSALKALGMMPFDLVGGVVVIGMMFASRWWLVACGFAFVSIAPVIWVSQVLR